MLDSDFESTNSSIDVTLIHLDIGFSEYIDFINNVIFRKNILMNKCPHAIFLLRNFICAYLELFVTFTHELAVINYCVFLPAFNFIKGLMKLNL